jgi:hypothetical protein
MDPYILLALRKKRKEEKVEVDDIPPLADIDSVAGLTRRIEPVSLLSI